MESKEVSLDEYVASFLPTFEVIFPALLPKVVSFVYDLHLGHYKNVEAEEIRENTNKRVFSSLYAIEESSIRYLQYAVDHRNYEGRIEAIDYILKGIVTHPEQFPLDDVCQRKISVMLYKRKLVSEIS